MDKGKKVPGGDVEVVYTPVITLKNGRRIFAWQYGKKAFRLEIRKAR